MSSPEQIPQAEAFSLYPIDYGRPLEPLVGPDDTPDHASISFDLWRRMQGDDATETGYSSALGSVITHHAHKYAARGRGGLALHMMDIAAIWPDSVVSYHDYARIALLMAEPTHAGDDPGAPSVLTAMAIILDDERMRIGRHLDGFTEGPFTHEEHAAHALWWASIASTLCRYVLEVEGVKGRSCDAFYNKLSGALSSVEAYVEMHGCLPQADAEVSVTDMEEPLSFITDRFREIGLSPYAERMVALEAAAFALPPMDP